MERKKVILCGYNWSGCKALELLLEEGHDIFVYTHENPDHINSLKSLCEKRGVPYSLEKISMGNLPFIPDIICSIYYSYIIPDDVIKSAEGKAFNLHPSLLPKYKGCSSLTWAMIEGEKFVGYSFHYLTPDIDGGNIILRDSIKVEDFDTQITLYYRVMFEALKDFQKAFNHVLNEYKGKKQETGGSYNKRGCPYDGNIDPTWGDEKKERFIRAMIYPPLKGASYLGEEIGSYERMKKLDEIMQGLTADLI